MSTVQASTEGRKPLTTAQLYSAAHPKMNGALYHKAIDCDVTPCHCLAIGTVRCGDTQMAKTLKTFSATDSTGKVYTRSTSRDYTFCVVHSGLGYGASWASDWSKASKVVSTFCKQAEKAGTPSAGRTVEILLTKSAT